ncbi:MBL fold metallo-hydrolase [Piscinibacter sakaiensis]|uniref:MBL fold metallo-hydrolase n=1 Tax=Piscinibacter sakaiensis TaxID=1547922 RepID=UPI003AAF32D4
MLLKTIVSEGLAHHSYLVGGGDEAAIVDPSRDVDRYLEAASDAGLRITRIFETHRNEDYISGACELAQRTGATVWRGRSPDFDVPYAKVAEEGKQFEFGDLRLKVLYTPGHTDDSISVVLVHTETGDSPVGVFTGDALFVGDVGRTDFYPDRAEEVAGLLYDSLHDKLLPIGDQAQIWPAHGSGSVCGSGIAKREFSTIGDERRNNPKLQLDRKAFIEAKTSEHHYKPPYFERMEAANMGDSPGLQRLPRPAPLAMQQLERSLANGAQLLDLRPGQSIAGACIAEAIAIPLPMLAAFGGWFLDSQRPIVLLLEQASDRERAVRTLVRIGFERIDGFLAGGADSWATAAKPLQALHGIDVHQLKKRLAGDQPPLLLDVRSIDEYEQGHIAGAEHHYVGQIEQKAPDLPRDRPIVTYCKSGKRALVAAAALRRLGHQEVSVCWGSIKAWQAAGFELTDARKAS